MADNYLNDTGPQNDALTNLDQEDWSDKPGDSRNELHRVVEEVTPLREDVARRMEPRGTAAVFYDHLALRLEGRVEEDISRNFATDVVQLCRRGKIAGQQGILESATQLARELPNAKFAYKTKIVDGEVAFLEWCATSEKARVRDGADSFVIRDGKIVAMTVHYTLESSDSSSSAI